MGPRLNDCLSLTHAPETSRAGSPGHPTGLLPPTTIHKHTVDLDTGDCGGEVHIDIDSNIEHPSTLVNCIHCALSTSNCCDHLGTLALAPGQLSTDATLYYCTSLCAACQPRRFACWACRQPGPSRNRPQIPRNPRIGSPARRWSPCQFQSLN